MKSEVTRLIEKYNREKGKRYNEEATKNDFILPLFKILGWDVEDSNEVSKEENISGKRVDYGFRIDGIPKFFLEAKGLDEDLEGSRMVKGRQVTYAEQAINYAYYKGCNWAILTNFKGIIVYDAWAKANSQSSFRFAVWVDSLLSDFESVYLLSKEAFEQGLLDKKYSTKSRKRPITEQLLLDFTTFRSILSKDVYNLNKSKNLTEEELDEAIQRLFDRLIFIRNCEDRELEPYELLSMVRQWKESRKGTLVSKIRDLFTHFDETYNSKIFSKHLCDQVDISDDVLSRVIDGLYTTEDGSILYDFSLIDADVLGNIYEQYLGHILKKTEKRAKLTESKAKRKEEGIYYTPSYIVDYIVRNTVGELVKNKKVDVSKIKILDPACGSGSFLIKTFDVLNEYYSRKDGYNQNKLDLSGTGTTYSTKLSILKDNIFGVDLDKQAVDIAQLNLLLKVAEKKRRLPILQQNIKNGNSLIDDPNLAGDKAFKWDEEFADIMSNGGFDVIVGNPPYVDIKRLDPKIVKYLFSSYTTVENRMNLYSTFVERALNLLKNGGYFGFIIPNSILYNESYQKIRTLLLNQTILTKIIRLPDDVFDGVKIETIILIYKKSKERSKSKECEVYLYPRDAKINSINEDNCPNIIQYNQNDWQFENHNINISANKMSKTILEKIEESSTKSLIDICDFSLGLTPYDKYKGHSQQQINNRIFHSDTKKNETFKPLLSGENIIRYGIFWDKKEHISYGNWLGAPREKRFFTSPHIVVRQIISGKPPRIYAGYTEEELYNTQIGFNLVSKNENEFRIKYILALLNSKLMSYYHKEKYLDPTKTLFQKILIANAKRFPIKAISISEQDKVVELVEKIIKLNKKLSQFDGKKTDESSKILDEINKVDLQIDIFIYKIYGLTTEERKVIEESLKGG